MLGERQFKNLSFFEQVRSVLTLTIHDDCTDSLAIKTFCTRHDMKKHVRVAGRAQLAYLLKTLNTQPSISVYKKSRVEVRKFYLISIQAHRATFCV